MNIGDILKNRRNELGLSLAKLRDLTGLSKSTLSDIENGKSNPKIATLEKICDALNIEIKDVLENEQIQKNENTYFDTATAAMEFILSQPSIMAYGGFDIRNMSDKDKIDFANDLLQQLKLLSYKYKK